MKEDDSLDSLLALDISRLQVLNVQQMRIYVENISKKKLRESMDKLLDIVQALLPNQAADTTYALILIVELAHSFMARYNEKLVEDVEAGQAVVQIVGAIVSQASEITSTGSNQTNLRFLDSLGCLIEACQSIEEVSGLAAVPAVLILKRSLETPSKETARRLVKNIETLTNALNQNDGRGEVWRETIYGYATYIPLTPTLVQGRSSALCELLTTGLLIEPFAKGILAACEMKMSVPHLKCIGDSLRLALRNTQGTEHDNIVKLCRALLHAALLSESACATRLRGVLFNATHGPEARKRTGSNELLESQYKPYIRRMLRAAHPTARSNALLLLGESFPLGSSESGSVLAMAIESLKDDVPLVRQSAMKACTDILIGCWKVVEVKQRQEILSFLVAEGPFDASSPAGRSFSLDCLKNFVEAGDEASDTVIGLIQQNKHFTSLARDKSPKVVAAFLGLCGAIGPKTELLDEALLLDILQLNRNKGGSGTRELLSKMSAAQLLPTFVPSVDTESAASQGIHRNGSRYGLLLAEKSVELLHKGGRRTHTELYRAALAFPRQVPIICTAAAAMTDAVKAAIVSNGGLSRNEAFALLDASRAVLSRLLAIGEKLHPKDTGVQTRGQGGNSKVRQGEMFDAVQKATKSLSIHLDQCAAVGIKGSWSEKSVLSRRLHRLCLKVAVALSAVGASTTMTEKAVRKLFVEGLRGSPNEDNPVLVLGNLTETREFWGEDVDELAFTAALLIRFQPTVAMSLLEAATSTLQGVSGILDLSDSEDVEGNKELCVQIREIATSQPFITALLVVRHVAQIQTWQNGVMPPKTVRETLRPLLRLLKVLAETAKGISHPRRRHGGGSKHPEVPPTALSCGMEILTKCPSVFGLLLDTAACFSTLQRHGEQPNTKQVQSICTLLKSVTRELKVSGEDQHHLMMGILSSINTLSEFTASACNRLVEMCVGQSKEQQESGILSIRTPTTTQTDAHDSMSGSQRSEDPGRILIKLLSVSGELFIKAAELSLHITDKMFQWAKLRQTDVVIGLVVPLARLCALLIQWDVMLANSGRCDSSIKIGEMKRAATTGLVRILVNLVGPESRDRMLTGVVAQLAKAVGEVVQSVLPISGLQDWLGAVLDGLVIERRGGNSSVSDDDEFNHVDLEAVSGVPLGFTKGLMKLGWAGALFRSVQGLLPTFFGETVDGWTAKTSLGALVWLVERMMRTIKGVVVPSGLLLVLDEIKTNMPECITREDVQAKLHLILGSAEDNK